jgi:acyl-CoA synthetase (AMP-forming)/AMP-acid ligase II
VSASSEQNVVTLLAGAAAACGSRSALTLQDAAGHETSITFAQLWDAVDRTSTGLRSIGFAPGDRAILMVPMSIDLYVALLAVVKCGAIAVFVDPWVSRQQLAAFATFAKARSWIGIPKSHLLRLITPDLRKIPLTITTGRRWFGWGGRFTLKELQSHHAEGAIHPVDKSDTAMITFTGGSSGLPKGVNRTHGFLTAQHAALQAEFPQQQTDIDMPMFPVFALNNLARGIPSIIPAMDFRRVDEVDGAIIAAQIERQGVTTCTASPPFIDRLADYQGTHPPARALRRILTGGAPVSDRQLQRWSKTWPNTEIVVVYGSTEAEPVAHVHAAERLQLAGASKKADGYCIGSPSERVRLRVIKIERGPIALDAHGWKPWELPQGEAGEIVVSGEHVAESYFQNAEATAENKIKDADGAIWHRMGDTAYIDAEGRVWLVGRVHSTIRRAGQVVHPQIVEQVAAGDTEPALRVAAVGVADPSLGERVVVVVESSAGESVLQEVRRRLQEAGLPVDEVCLADRPLPLDPRHRSKIDYHALRAELQQR